MDQLAVYHSDGSDSEAPAASHLLPARTDTDSLADTAPAVPVAPHTFTVTDAMLVAPGATELAVNVPLGVLTTPMQGPMNPFRPSTATGTNNVLTGHVETHAISDFHFTQLARNFSARGYTAQPDVGLLGPRLIGDLAAAALLNGDIAYNNGPPGTGLKAKATRKRKAKGDPGSVDGYSGPWAGYVDEIKGTPCGPSEAQLAAVPKASSTATTRTTARVSVNVAASPADPRAGDADAQQRGGERSVFHGKSELDYLGRTYMHPPTDVDVSFTTASAPKCFLPKRLIHTYAGHPKGVNVCRFIPKSSHLFLSGGMDGKIKLWDTYHDGALLRSYLGHSKAIKDIAFTPDGSRFLSASYDRNIKLWETETGRCIRSFHTNQVPNCVVWNPGYGRQHVFLVGCADKKIYQYDSKTGKITQTYDQHLGAINSISFFDDARRFVSTSDDKTMRVWEYDIPVVIKYVADPSMHSQPVCAMHPNRKSIVYTSLDNQLFVYKAKENFKVDRDKHFTGLLLAGYACKPSFSPDGRFLACGDSEGNIWFWDWKSGNELKYVMNYGRNCATINIPNKTPQSPRRRRNWLRVAQQGNKQSINLELGWKHKGSSSLLV